MDIYTASETAYKNGYEAGVKIFAERLKAQYVDYDNNVGAVGKSTLYKAIDRIKKELTESKNDFEG